VGLSPGGIKYGGRTTLNQVYVLLIGTLCVMGGSA
jgi:hypothetical protein